MESKAVLWDLDGTLVDSEEFHWQAWKDALAAEGVTITRKQFLETFGQRNDTVIPRLLGGPAGRERVQRIADAKEEHYRGLVRTVGLTALPGVTEWLTRLTRAGWRQAVASSAPRLNLEVVLKATGLSECFQATVTAEDVQRGKPAPDVFLIAAERLATKPQNCIVVEDATAGIEAAALAGMKSILIRRDKGAAEDGAAPAGRRNDNAAKADLVADSLAGLSRDAFTGLLSAGQSPSKC